MMAEQVSEFLQKDCHIVYKLTPSGFIPSIKIVGQWRFKKDVRDNLITEEFLERV